MACSAGVGWAHPIGIHQIPPSGDAFQRSPHHFIWLCLRLSPGWPGWLHRQHCVSFPCWRLILPRTWISVAFLPLCGRGLEVPDGCLRSVRKRALDVHLFLCFMRILPSSSGGLVRFSRASSHTASFCIWGSFFLKSSFVSCQMPSARSWLWVHGHSVLFWSHQ